MTMTLAPLPRKTSHSTCSFPRKYHITFNKLRRKDFHVVEEHIRIQQHPPTLYLGTSHLASLAGRIRSLANSLIFFGDRISGKARCLEDDVHDDDLDGSLRSITSLKSGMTDGSSRSIGSSTAGSSSSRRQRIEHLLLSTPSSPTSRKPPVLGRRNSKSLDNVVHSTRSLDHNAHSSQSNATFQLSLVNKSKSTQTLSRESHSTRSLLLQDQLASIRSILEEDT